MNETIKRILLATGVIEEVEQEQQEPKQSKIKSFFGIKTRPDFAPPKPKKKTPYQQVCASIAKSDPFTMANQGAMDSSGFGIGENPVPEDQIDFFASHANFMGWQNLAIVSQHWLIRKACEMPALDALRNGFEAVADDGQELDKEAVRKIKRLDKKMGIKAAATEAITKARIFGVAYVFFDFSCDFDDKYLEKPFNPDAIKPGTYRGIKVIEPRYVVAYCTNTSNPLGDRFFEPEYYSIFGRKVHHSHIIRVVHSEVPDQLKPTYMYGGVSVVQQIMESAYAASITANEAARLVHSKRTTVFQTESDIFSAGQAAIEEKLLEFSRFRDNFSVLPIGDSDSLSVTETGLAGLSEVIMTGLQVVAAASNVPATKLLGTSPSGFQSTGAHEIATYHELLETIQEHDAAPIIERHWIMTQRSEGAAENLTLTVAFEKLDVLTEQDQANVNKIKADTAAVWVDLQVISPEELRQQLATDKNSGFNHIGAELPPELLGDGDNDWDKGSPENDKGKIDKGEVAENPEQSLYGNEFQFSKSQE